MNIAVLSGKGGTGKTTVSTNLAALMGVNYIDCDVEEPNGFIFLNPADLKKSDVLVDYPEVDSSKCVLCGECAKACQFNALVKTKKNIIVLQKQCHSCGACEIACRHKALVYKKRKTGVIEEGRFGTSVCKRGILDVGEPMAVPVIKELLSSLPEGINIIDCAPGTSCNVVNALQYADAEILVTEPTEFGLHDLKMAVKLVKMLNKPFGVVINKHMQYINNIQKYCEEESIPVLGRVPYSRDAAKIYSNGRMLIDSLEYHDIFKGIAHQVKEAFIWSL